VFSIQILRKEITVSELKTRAIYKEDMRFENIPVFELNDDYFEMIGDEECRYSKEDVYSDETWIIVEFSVRDIENAQKSILCRH
jgi:hypothetical protein